VDDAPIIKQGIYFDLDTNALKQYYPKPSWNHAYDDIKSFLKSNGFEWEQGSGYHSKEPMLFPEAFEIIENMADKYPWLNKCVNACNVSDVPVTTNVTFIFDKTADIPERED